MLKIIVAVLLSLSLSATALAQTPGDPSAYNKGVAAWRAKDYAEARRQWEQSLAEEGPDEVLNNLAFLLYNGLGGAVNREKAVELWRKGSTLAVSEAQWHLGLAYEEGGGVARNLPNAFAWYRCAIATATQAQEALDVEADIRALAEKSLAEITPKLSEKELAEAESLAQEYTAKYSSRQSTTKP